jgi:hypothetical protein
MQANFRAGIKGIGWQPKLNKLAGGVNLRNRKTILQKNVGLVVPQLFCNSQWKKCWFFATFRNLVKNAVSP